MHLWPWSKFIKGIDNFGDRHSAQTRRHIQVYSFIFRDFSRLLACVVGSHTYIFSVDAPLGYCLNVCSSLPFQLEAVKNAGGEIWKPLAFEKAEGQLTVGTNIWNCLFQCIVEVCSCCGLFGTSFWQKFMFR